MLQKNPENEPMREQQQGHQESLDEVGGPQLPGQKTGVICLVESVQEIGRAPDVEDPYDDNSN